LKYRRGKQIIYGEEETFFGKEWSQGHQGLFRRSRKKELGKGGTDVKLTGQDRHSQTEAIGPKTPGHGQKRT